MKYTFYVSGHTLSQLHGWKLSAARM